MAERVNFRRPLVVANFAVTVDGKTSTRNFTPSLFTSPADKARLEEIRAENDAVLAGRGTVAADTMSMGLSRADLREARRAAGRAEVPLRVVVSNAGRFDPGWKIFQYQASPLVIFSTTRLSGADRSRLAPHADLHLFDRENVPLGAVLRTLREDYGVKRLVCEGGGTLLRAMAAEDFLDELHLTIAPVIFGGRGAPTLTGLPGGFLPSACEFRTASRRVVDGECFLHLKRVRKTWH